MADEYDKLSVEVRTHFGKGAARKIRANDKIPAVIYGHGTEPKHVTLPGHETMLLVRKSNAVIDLDIEGDAQLVLVKDIQRDPVKQTIEHLDLLVVRRGERVEVEVYVNVEGESAPGTISTQMANTLLLEVEATHIPESVSVSVEGREEGSHVHAGEVALPKGASLVNDPELIVVNISQPAGEAAAEGEGEVAEAEAAVDETPAE